MRRSLLALAVFALPLSGTGSAVADPPVELRSEANGRCLDVYLPATGTPQVYLWDCLPSTTQRWSWNGDEIRTTLNNTCLEVPFGTGTRVGLWDCWGGPNQRWYRDGAQIRNRMNDKCLQILSFNIGAPVDVGDCVGGVNQRWRQVG